jgi:preprotein translocase subunit YajC
MPGRASAAADDPATGTTSTMETMLLAQAQPQGGSAFLAWLPLIVIFFLFWVMIIAPQRKQARAHQEMVAGLQKGDQVVTMGGLIGEILAVKDDQVQLKTGNSTVVVERARIARKNEPPAPGEKQG